MMDNGASATKDGSDRCGAPSGNVGRTNKIGAAEQNGCDPSSLPKWNGPTRVSYASIVVNKHDESYDWQGREERELSHAAATDCGTV
jgi:hypothetical protein